MVNTIAATVCVLVLALFLVLWALSHAAWNRLWHILHGNPPKRPPPAMPRVAWFQDPRGLSISLRTDPSAFWLRAVPPRTEACLTRITDRWRAALLVIRITLEHSFMHVSIPVSPSNRL